MTRCKFVCQLVKKIKHWSDATPFLYEAEFTIVTYRSEENRKFFEDTPSGILKVGVYKKDIFEVGKEYYIDISLA